LLFERLEFLERMLHRCLRRLDLHGHTP
jgi:hypothetical protein